MNRYLLVKYASPQTFFTSISKKTAQEIVLDPKFVNTKENLWEIINLGIEVFCLQDMISVINNCINVFS